MSTASSSSSSSAASSNALHLQHSVPKIPVYPFKWTNDGGQMENNVLRGRGIKSESKKQQELMLTTTGSGKQTGSSNQLLLQRPAPKANHLQQAFHKDSLNVIAKFNERRCHGMPLYGQDLIEVLTIGKNHALKKYDQFTLNTISYFWGSNGLNIIQVVQFHEIFVTNMNNVYE